MIVWCGEGGRVLGGGNEEGAGRDDRMGRAHNICAHCAGMCVWVCVAMEEEKMRARGSKM